MTTWIVLLIIIGLVSAAARSVLRAHRKGGCIGCDACGGCGHCAPRREKK